MKTFSILLLSLLAFVASAQPSTIEIEQFTNDTYLLKASNYSTNIGMIKSGNGVLLIDPMPGNDNISELYRQVQQKFSPETIRIVNTHAHEDHTGGNSVFVAKGATVLGSTENIPDLQLISVRSHSNTDHILFHKTSNVMFVGDIYDTSWHPTFYAGGIAGFLEAVDTILDLANNNTVIVPGHGKYTGIQALQTYKRKTIEWASRVKALHLQGQSAAEIRDDEQIQFLLQYFAENDTRTSLPSQAVTRFIERTLNVIEQSQNETLN